MFSRVASILLSSPRKQKLKSAVRRVQMAYVTRFQSYDSADLIAVLRDLGIAEGDVMIVHGSYSFLNGFRGSPSQVITALQEAVGGNGTLLMPSSPYTGSTEDYLNSAEVFDVRHTPSRMGMISEMFRRQPNTQRSLNPAHPVLASGTLASWFVEGHESCTYSCGPGSPFERLLETDAKALFFDVKLANLMFFHYLEHVVKDTLPFALYDPKVYRAIVIDRRDREIVVPVRAFSKTARALRRFEVLETELRANNVIQSCRIGNTRLALVRIRDTLEITRRLLDRGEYFYDLTMVERTMRP